MKKLLLRISIPVFILIFASSVMAASLGGFGINPGGFWKQIGNNLSLVNSAFNVIVNSYLNFGTVGGETGYGIRDNSGAMEVKDDGGAWAGISTLGSISATAPLQWASGTGIMSILQSGTASDGYLNSTDWNIFNNKLDNVVEDTTPELGGNLDALTNDISNVGTLTVTDLAAGTVTISSGVTDRDIIIGYNAASLADESVIFNRFGETNAVLLWDETNDEFNFNDDLKIDGSQVIDTTNAEALLVRKDGDAGDILTVNTTDSLTTIQGGGAATMNVLDIYNSQTAANDNAVTATFHLNNATADKRSFAALQVVATDVAGASRDGRLDLQVVSSTRSANAMETVMSLVDGKVGIGTASPGRLLDVTANGNSFVVEPRVGDIVVGAFTNVPLSLRTNNVEVLRLGTTGNVELAQTTAQLLLPISNDAATPTLAFGDGDTGLFESSANNINLSLAGTSHWKFLSSGQIRSELSGAGAQINGNASSDIIPAFTFRGDPISGLGLNDTGELSLIATSIEAMRLDANDSKIYPFMDMELGSIEAAQDSGSITLFNMPVSSTPTVGDEMSASFSIDSEVILKVSAEADGTGGIQNKQVIFGPSGSFGSAGNPTIALGDGDTGFYETADDTLSVAVGGGERFRFTTTVFGASNTGRSALLNEDPSSTNPNIIPNQTDTNTGMGWAGADNLSLIAGGLEAIRAEDPADLAATETSLWLYDADNGTLQQVTVGADDSGGSGFKLLRIAN